MKNIAIKTAAVAALALALAPVSAYAGHGGSAAAIGTAISSHSIDAIVSEVERTENLICDECIQLVTNLTEDSRFEVREVAAWWFARRPLLRDMLASQFLDDLTHGDTTKVRNAADFVGHSGLFSSVPQLRAAMHRSALGSDAKLAIVGAVGFLAQTAGNDVLLTAMADSDATVRASAVRAWRDMMGQTSSLSIVPLLGDADARVRAQAASVVGGIVELSARPALERLVVGDPDSLVRRNAAWALGQIGSLASRQALIQASSDTSGLVRGFATAALAQLH